MEASDQKSELRQIERPGIGSPKTWALIDSVTEHQTIRLLMHADEDGGATAVHIAKRLKLTRGRICQILKRLEREEYVKSNTEIKKCYLCIGTGLSKSFPDRQCLACKGTGVKIRKGNPVFYSIRPEVKKEIQDVMNAAEAYSKLRLQVFRQ